MLTFFLALPLTVVSLILVCPQTEETTYPDAFFEYQDLIVNALDNVEARRYVDR
jgi:ubiquitin-activating enzyme E1-like protein 2